MKSQNLGLWMMLAASVALSACSKKKDGDNVTRVKGDPYAFVKHATMNGSPLLPATLFADQDSWVIGATAIIEGPATKTYAEVKEEQAPGHESDDAEGLVTAAKSLNPDGTISIVGGALKLVLVPETQGLRVAGLVIGGENIIGKPTIQVLHISHNVERGAVSILVYDSQRGERALAAFYLLKGPVAVLKMSWVDRAYEYIFGAGKKVRWNGDKPVEITKCTTAPESMMRLMDQAISPWMGVIGKRLSTASAADANCPPFTDLNTHTITYVDDWIELAGPAGVLGWTRPIRDVRNDEFLDSDVVILLGELKEGLRLEGMPSDVAAPSFYENAMILKLLRLTLQHEMGHFFGLHHKFDGTPSVMAYDPKANSETLTDYDRKAIDRLYTDDDAPATTQDERWHAATTADSPAALARPASSARRADPIR